MKQLVILFAILCIGITNAMAQTDWTKDYKFNRKNESFGVRIFHSTEWILSLTSYPERQDIDIHLTETLKKDGKWRNSIRYGRIRDGVFKGSGLSQEEFYSVIDSLSQFYYINKGITGWFEFQFPFYAYEINKKHRKNAMRNFHQVSGDIRLTGEDMTFLLKKKRKHVYLTITMAPYGTIKWKNGRVKSRKLEERVDSDFIFLKGVDLFFKNTKQ